MKANLILALIFIMALGGCATYQAYKSGASDDVKKAAMCSDAALGLSIVATALPLALQNNSTAELQYWSNWKTGADAVRVIACGASK